MCEKYSAWNWTATALSEGKLANHYTTMPHMIYINSLTLIKSILKICFLYCIDVHFFQTVLMVIWCFFILFSVFEDFQGRFGGEKASSLLQIFVRDIQIPMLRYMASSDQSDLVRISSQVDAADSGKNMLLNLLTIDQKLLICNYCVEWTMYCFNSNVKIDLCYFSLYQLVISSYFSME